jgi:hypothetical protein
VLPDPDSEGQRLSQVYKPKMEITPIEEPSHPHCQDSHGNTVDLTLGVITDKNDAIIANSIRFFADSEGNILDLKEIQDANNILPKFKIHILEDNDGNTLD